MGYYAKCSGHDEIYCLNTAMITAFNVDEISFIKMDTLPEIDDDYLTAFSVMNKKGNDFAAKKVTDAEKVDFTRTGILRHRMRNHWQPVSRSGVQCLVILRF